MRRREDPAPHGCLAVALGANRTTTSIPFRELARRSAASGRE